MPVAISDPIAQEPTLSHCRREASDAEEGLVMTERWVKGMLWAVGDCQYQ
ncbi:hypothetical protein [Roseimaritima multifibrata]|nr:hypothetical protein [Roseimaritima multifibrata]